MTKSRVFLMSRQALITLTSNHKKTYMSKEFKIVVLAKQVPDTRNVGKDAMTPEGTVNRAALPAIFNPEDLNALEQAPRHRRYPRRTVSRSRWRRAAHRPRVCRRRHAGHELRAEPGNQEDRHARPR